MADRTRLDLYDNSWYNPGNAFVRFLWYIANAVFFKSYLLPVSSLKALLLRIFGCKVGKGVVIKPGVNIKYPWKLKIGDHVWIGEGVWIDNLGKVVIGDHVCLSQGAVLLCGNHDYTKPTFDLMVGDIVLEDGVWIGAKAMVAPGITAGSHAVLSAMSLATSDLEAYSVYTGVPALKTKDRKFA